MTHTVHFRSRSIQQLSESSPERLVRLLPLLLDRLLLLLVRPPMVAGQVINTGQPCFQAIGQLVQRVSVSGVTFWQCSMVHFLGS